MIPSLKSCTPPWKGDHTFIGYRIQLQSLLSSVDFILLFNFQCSTCQSDLFSSHVGSFFFLGGV